MYWIFSSSGARRLYLENVVRALALPAGERLQFRYEETIVSPAFRKRVEECQAKGDVAYLTYLDNRDDAVAPTLYPIREAVIEKAYIRGTSIIIQLRVECFINWDAEPGSDLSAIVGGVAKDALPDFDRSGTKPTPIGFWAAEAQPLPAKWFVPYTPHGQKHLEAFESAVRACMRGTDFKNGQWLFATIEGVSRLPGNTHLNEKILSAGQNYEVVLYHYLSSRDTRLSLPDFTIEVSAETDAVRFLSPSVHRCEAEYDEVRFAFKVDEDIDDQELGLNFRISAPVLQATGAPQSSLTILDARILYRVKRSHLGKWARVAIVGTGVAAAQLVSLIAAGKPIDWAAPVIAVASFVAAAALVFKIPRA